MPQFPTPALSVPPFLPSFLLGQEITGSRGWSTTKIELYFGTSAIRAGSLGPSVEIQVWQRPPRTPAAVPGTHTGLSLCHGEHGLCHSPPVSCVTAHHCPGATAAGPGCSCPLGWALTSLPRMPVCSELGGVGTAVGAEGCGGDKDDIGSTTGNPVGLSRHGGDGDRRGDTHPPCPGRSVRPQEPGATPASRAQ